jgi:hypothetical protein
VADADGVGVGIGVATGVGVGDGDGAVDALTDGVGVGAGSAELTAAFDTATSDAIVVRAAVVVAMIDFFMRFSPLTPLSSGFCHELDALSCGGRTQDFHLITQSSQALFDCSHFGFA